MADESCDQMIRDVAGLPGVGTYVWQIPEDRLEWSAELCRIYGIERAPDTEHGFMELLHPDDRLRIEADTSAYLAEGDRYEHEFRIVRPNGEIRVIHDRGIIERAANGSPLRIRGINVDVTGHRPMPASDVHDGFDRHLLDLALEAADQGAWDYDVAFDRVRWDERTRRLFGVPADAPLSFERVVGTMVHPDDREKVTAAYRAATDRAGDGRYEVEHRVLRGDGAVRRLAVHGQALFEDVGPQRRAARMVGTVRDVTERREAAARLQESGELLRLALGAGGMGVWRADFEGGRAWCDPTIRALFGLGPGPEEGPLDEIADRFHPDDRREVLGAWHALEPGQALRREFRVRAGDGSERWLAGVGEKRRIGHGGEVIAVGLNWDITEQKRTEARIRESEALFRSMADDLPHMVWMHGPDGAQEFVNQTFCDYFGVTREDMRDQKWQVLVHPEDAAGYAEEFMDCVRDRRRFHAEVRVRNGAGAWRWVESWGTPRFDDDGRYLGHLGTSADITDRKREEQLRRLLLEELDHRVKNTFALIQAMARQSLKGHRPIATERDAFVGRLRALAGANDLLTRENWEKARLSDLVSDALVATGALEDRYRVEGPDVVLQPRQAISMAVALHELGTNAVKYGALRGERGRVSVAWTVSGGEAPRLSLMWSESDGPAVSPPASRGFGSMILEQALAAELGAEVRMEFRPDGLRWSMDADLT